MANPKIVYTPDGGSETTLNFARPPRQKSCYQRAATRHDNVSTAGLRETIVERIDDFLDLTVEWIPVGTELGDWEMFLDHALTGAPFAYYPDADVPTLANYVLEDQEARLDLQAPGRYSVSLKLRRQVL